MENGIKFDMFASLEERDFNAIENEEVEVVSVTAKSDTKKKYSTVTSRTKEEYETFIESIHYETLTHPTTGEEYQVKVTVLKPEVNPLENMRPVFAYSTNH
ncbi:hypothetical protein SEPL_337 [Salmonella phage SE_PL]|uniref:hypothetical protein n=1 Tax=Salmonella enterica TaxID=28901 RepID=UPI000FDF692B|nr:hypothetical protein CPT_Munch_086 [Salmonella phage Munch]EAZ2022883.1 hypothetical protein [Salmonella enterica]ECV9084017.1 hypothetical protein [Salmonella enterica subsp. enterica serovar Infantis]QCW18761.1 hypothetical protein 7t3_0240 [Salmonella phage 7t3]QIG62950.1 hypothetical protein SEPL_337 [Salmonella phage SE_PL]WNV47192.1 hypothetical protein [Klebsiella phage fENko-Kae01]